MKTQKTSKRFAFESFHCFSNLFTFILNQTRAASMRVILLIFVASIVYLEFNWFKRSFRGSSPKQVVLQAELNCSTLDEVNQTEKVKTNKTILMAQENTDGKKIKSPMFKTPSAVLQELLDKHKKKPVYNTERDVDGYFKSVVSFVDDEGTKEGLRRR